jgi:hypothetical protein
MRRFPGDGRTCPRPSDWARSYDIVILAARCMRDLPSPALCDCPNAGYCTGSSANPEPLASGEPNASHPDRASAALARSGPAEVMENT